MQPRRQHGQQITDFRGKYSARSGIDVSSLSYDARLRAPDLSRTFGPHFAQRIDGLPTKRLTALVSPKVGYGPAGYGKAGAQAFQCVAHQDLRYTQ